MLNARKDTLEEMITIVNKNGFEGMTEIFQLLLNQAMEVERSEVLKAKPYERSVDRRGYANGFKPKNIQTRMGSVDLRIPQVRGDVEYYPEAIEKGLRSERALKIAISEMYIQGVSTRKTKAVMEKLCGFNVSSTQVSRASQELDETLMKWRNRPLGRYSYVYLDATYEKVRVDKQVQSAAVFIAIGVTPEGKRSIIGVSTAISEAEVHWRSFFESLKERGLRGVQLIVSDDHSGLKAARQSVFSGIPWQRCQFHLQQNAQKYITKHSLKKEISRKIKRIFDAENGIEAESRRREMIQKYSESQPKLVSWIEENLQEGLIVFEFPEHHRKRLRTTNPLERLNREIKRRTRVVSIFPNEAALLRLTSAILAEQDDDWSTQNQPYLTFNN
jgi:putative transposase